MPTESPSPVHPILVVRAAIVLYLDVSPNRSFAVKIQLELSVRGLKLPAFSGIKTPVFMNDPVHRLIWMSAFGPDHESIPKKTIHSAISVFAHDSREIP